MSNTQHNTNQNIQQKDDSATFGNSLSPAVKHLLEKQQYEFCGSHSAVKICGWTKNSLRDEGVCYKEKFYGLKCHRCVQMSVAVNICDLNCVYCWRDRNNFPFKNIDEPKDIIKNAIKAQRHKLTGFGGAKKTNLIKWEESKNPIHFAISLTGEMLYYPKLGEFIHELKKQNFTSFLVTNGQLPDVLEKIEMPTQLYISLDSPDEELHKKLCRPDNGDSWKRLMKSLDVMKKRKSETRTTLRLTIIKNLNDHSPEGYIKLINRANPHFVEVKAYMFLGASQENLQLENMPYHEEVKAFANKICECSDYKIIDEHKKSRVVLLMKDDFKERIMKF